MMVFHGVPLACINQAAVHYHVPATLILSVMQVEGGRNGMANPNKDGSRDLGVMQINSRWLSTLNVHGITEKELQFNACKNVQVGAWILAKAIIKEEGWKGVGNYHSVTPRLNIRYHEKVRSYYQKMQNLLEENHESKEG